MNIEERIAQERERAQKHNEMAEKLLGLNLDFNDYLVLCSIGGCFIDFPEDVGVDYERVRFRSDMDEDKLIECLKSLQKQGFITIEPGFDLFGNPTDIVYLTDKTRQYL